MKLRNADFENWRLRKLWSLEEGLQLLFGIEPVHNLLGSLVAIENVPYKIIGKFRTRLDIATRSVDAGVLKPDRDHLVASETRYYPSTFLNWVASVGWDIPEDLASLLNKSEQREKVDNWPVILASEAYNGLPLFLGHDKIVELWYSGRGSNEQKKDLTQKIGWAVITGELKGSILRRDPVAKGGYSDLPVERWQDIKDGSYGGDYVTYRIHKDDFAPWMENAGGCPDDSLLNQWWQTPLGAALQEKPDYEEWERYEIFAPLTEAICFALGVHPENRARWSRVERESYDKLLRLAQAAILADALKKGETGGVMLVNKASFFEWATKQGEQLVDAFLARPPVSREQQRESVPKIYQQVKAIVNTAVKLGFDPMKVPDGGKAKIKALCLDDSRLFTGASFDHAWKAAKKPPYQCIQIENPERYRARS